MAGLPGALTSHQTGPPPLRETTTIDRRTGDPVLFAHMRPNTKSARTTPTQRERNSNDGER